MTSPYASNSLSLSGREKLNHAEATKRKSSQACICKLIYRQRTERERDIYGFIAVCTGKYGRYLDLCFVLSFQAEKKFNKSHTNGNFS